MPLSLVLQEHLPQGKIIDFMSIDCEGYDHEVIKSNDWSVFRPKIVLIEDHEGKRDSKTEKTMLSVGYQYRRKLGLTKVFVDL